MPSTPATARSTSGHAGEIGRDEALVRSEIGRRLEVAQPELGIGALEQRRSRVPMPPAAPVTRTVCMMLARSNVERHQAGVASLPASR